MNSVKVMTPLYSSGLLVGHDADDQLISTVYVIEHLLEKGVATFERVTYLVQTVAEIIYGADLPLLPGVKSVKQPPDSVISLVSSQIIHTSLMNRTPSSFGYGYD